MPNRNLEKLENHCAWPMLYKEEIKGDDDYNLCLSRKSYLSIMPTVMAIPKKIGEPLYMAYAIQRRDKWQ